LIQWQAYNEGWGEGDPKQSNDTITYFRSLEQGQRLLNDASGGRGFGCERDGWPDPSLPNCTSPSRCMSIFWTGGCTGDVTDHHNYPNPELPFDIAKISNANGKPFLQGEYGGYSLHVKGHAWQPCPNAAIANPPGATINITNRSADFTHSSSAYHDSRAHEGVRTVTTDNLPDQGLTDAFVDYNQMASALLEGGLVGQIFTQISDIECEQSGLLTYDRLPKADFAQVAAPNNLSSLSHLTTLLSSLSPQVAASNMALLRNASEQFGFAT
jgi:hypothetical protein